MFTKIRTATVLCFIAVAAAVAMSLGTAAPAGATIRFCSAVRLYRVGQRMQRSDEHRGCHRGR